jgi:hypothetical protein
MFYLHFNSLSVVFNRAVLVDPRGIIPLLLYLHSDLNPTMDDKWDLMLQIPSVNKADGDGLHVGNAVLTTPSLLMPQSSIQVNSDEDFFWDLRTIIFEVVAIALHTVALAIVMAFFLAIYIHYARGIRDTADDS